MLREVNELLAWIDKQKDGPFDIEGSLVNLHANVLMSTLMSKRFVTDTILSIWENNLEIISDQREKSGCFQSSSTS